jgi:hypothetical protein
MIREIYEIARDFLAISFFSLTVLGVALVWAGYAP